MNCEDHRTPRMVVIVRIKHNQGKRSPGDVPKALLRHVTVHDISTAPKVVLYILPARAPSQVGHIASLPDPDRFLVAHFSLTRNWDPQNAIPHE